MKAVSDGRAVWLIARLRLRRLWNMIIGFRFGASKPGMRGATARKRSGAILPALVAAIMLASLLNVAHQSTLNLQCYLAPGSACLRTASDSEPWLDLDVAAAELHAGPLAQAVQLGLTLQLAMLFLVSVMLPLSSRAIAAADWDLEWLVTLPARRRTLLWGRILERTLANPTGLILLIPSCTMTAWFAGHGWRAPLVGIAASLLLLPLAAMLRTLADTGLRIALAPSQLRNVQALTAIFGMPLMYLAYSFGTMRAGSKIEALAAGVPPSMLWTPPGLLIRAIDAPSVAAAAVLVALLLASIAVPLWAGMALLQFQLRRGVVAAGARDTGRAARPLPRASGALARLLPASPIKRRELRLLGRDRNFLIQSLLLPLIVVGSQLVFSGADNPLAEMAASPTFLTGLAFGIGSYMLMLSAFQTIHNEGQSLWMLYTFPWPIERVLREKAVFWGTLALLYPLMILGAGLYFAPGQTGGTLARFAMVLAGIPLFSFIAVALGVFACDPLSDEARHRIKPGYSYLYLLLSALYVYAVSGDEWARKLVFVVLMAVLAAALWQKACAHLPYLLDPVAAPPARASAAGGLIAALLMYAAQGGVYASLRRLGNATHSEAVVFSYACAALVVAATLRLYYLLAKTGAVPAMFAQLPSTRMLCLQGAAGVALALVMERMFIPAYSAAIVADSYWLMMMLLLLTPLCEEFIFRGLIFGTLRRSMGLLPSALISAALFALVHPPVSIVPLFVMGLCAAWVYDKTRGLLAPVLVHASYNAIILLQLF